MRTDEESWSPTEDEVSTTANSQNDGTSDVPNNAWKIVGFYTNLNLHNLKRAANRDLRRMKTAARNGKYSGEAVKNNEKWYER